MARPERLTPIPHVDSSRKLTSLLGPTRTRFGRTDKSRESIGPDIIDGEHITKRVTRTKGDNHDKSLNPTKIIQIHRLSWYLGLT